MNKILLLPVISILFICAPAFADWAKGLYAYQKSDYVTAFKEWKPLAEQGDIQAQRALGHMYDASQGVIQDYRAAVKWYRLAAEQGDANAQDSLGFKYVLGDGVIKDYVRAHMWWNIAASQGFASSAKHRDGVSERMTRSQIEKAQKLARECVAKNYKGC
jgi:TPR repeat protein